MISLSTLFEKRILSKERTKVYRSLGKFVSKNPKANPVTTLIGNQLAKDAGRLLGKNDKASLVYLKASSKLKRRGSKTE